MAFLPAENPSPWGVPIPNLQAPYQPFLRRDIETLRFKCHSLDSELFYANRCREAESAMVKRLQDERKELNRTIDDLKNEIEELKSMKSEGPVKEIGELKPVKTEAVSTERVSELDQMNKALKKENRALEVEFRKLEAAMKVTEVQKIKQKKLDRLSAKIVELQKEKKVNEIRQEKQKKLSAKIVELEKEKKSQVERMMRSLEERVSQLDFKNGVLEKEKRTETERRLNESLALEDRIRVLESKERENTDEIDGLSKKDFELVKEKRELEAKDCQKCQEKSEEVQRILKEKEALEDKREKQFSELVKCIRELEDENNELHFKVSQAKMEKNYEKKGAIEDYEKKISELVGRNEVLERDKEALEAAVMKITEKSMEIERILNEKMSLEADKKSTEDEGMKIIEAWEREDNQMEAKACQAKQENSEEVQRILNETKAAKEGYDKQISELVDRNDSLEKEKNRLEGKKKELKIEIDFLTSMLVENIQITQQLCLSNNAVTSTTPQQSEGQKSAGMALSGEESINRSALKIGRKVVQIPANANTHKLSRNLRSLQARNRRGVHKYSVATLQESI